MRCKTIKAHFQKTGDTTEVQTAWHAASQGASSSSRPAASPKRRAKFKLHVQGKPKSKRRVTPPAQESAATPAEVATTPAAPAPSPAAPAPKPTPAPPKAAAATPAPPKAPADKSVGEGKATTGMISVGDDDTEEALFVPLGEEKEEEEKSTLAGEENGESEEDGEEEDDEEEEPSEKGSDTDRLLDEPTTTAQLNEDLQDVWVTAGDGPEGSTDHGPDVVGMVT